MGSLSSRGCSEEAFAGVQLPAKSPKERRGINRGNCKMPGTVGVLRATGSTAFARECKIGVPIKSPHEEKN